MIEATHAAEHYERDFDLFKDDISLLDTKTSVREGMASGKARYRDTSYLKIKPCEYLRYLNTSRGRTQYINALSRSSCRLTPIDNYPIKFYNLILEGQLYKVKAASRHSLNIYMQRNTEK